MKNILLLMGLCGTFMILCTSIFSKVAEYPARGVLHSGDIHDRSMLQNGDLVFQTSKSGQSLAIQKATHSQYSHVGIVFCLEDSAPKVFEAVQPVKLTPLNEWVDRGLDGHFIAKRLQGTQLTETQINAMTAFGKQWIGTDYDRNFQWDNNLMYCSELAWKIYSEGAGVNLCVPNKVESLDLDHPEVRSFVQNRFGGIDRIPDESLMVSPADLFNSTLLTVVHREQ